MRNRYKIKGFYKRTDALMRKSNRAKIVRKSHESKKWREIRLMNG